MDAHGAVMLLPLLMVMLPTREGITPPSYGMVVTARVVIVFIRDSL